MASVDLNIINRGVSGSNWTTQAGKITVNDLDKIAEQRSDNSSALNALPTPFARFFVVREAFRRVLEQKRDSNKAAGKAYESLVSDCLDIFEIIFNKLFHEAKKETIIVKEWELDENLRTLSSRVPILERSINDYYNTDISEPKLYFVIYNKDGKEYLLGTSSPMTGFITPPDLDKDYKKGNNFNFIGGDKNRYKDVCKLKRKGNKGYYFKDILLFESRSEDFKNYMFQLFNEDNLNKRFDYLRDYIKSFQNDSYIRNDYNLNLKSYQTSNGNDVEINGLQLSYNNDIGNYFTDTIIKLPYSISSDNYQVPQYIDNTEANHDYLIPLTDEALMKFDVRNLNVRYKVNSSNIKVTISVNGKDVSKTYTRMDSHHPEDGRIIDLEDAKLNFDLGLFPNIKSDNEEYNNYYKLMLVTHDANGRPTFSIKDVNCDFYICNDNGNSLLEKASDDNFKNGVIESVVRSEQNENTPCGSKFFELFNTSFDFMKVSMKIEGVEHQGVVVPQWTKVKKTPKSFIYAIDFGTSNTFISRREKKEEASEPEQLTMTNPIMSYLHAKSNSTQKTEIDLWEDYVNQDILRTFQTEFIPPFIDGMKYKFPIRTALCKSEKAVEKPKLFDHKNIAFSYGKHKVVGQQSVETDIKWSENGSEEARLFIRELLMLIKYDILQENGDLHNTDIIWFRPLSFKSSVREAFEEIWEKESKAILGLSDNQLKCYTESEAPYYYFSEKNYLTSIESVAVIDIGGGSTDIVYFENGKPLLANSVHFGCDVLWGNGYNKLTNADDNGIYQRYKDVIRFRTTNLIELNNDIIDLKRAKSTTKDIINFWINNNDETEINAKLKKDYKPLFLYHYAAIIFYLAEMFKSKGLQSPRTIIFSGNGSRYIDNYLAKGEDLNILTQVILKGVFGDAINNLQIILPEYRKESTCYGGLFRRPDLASPEGYAFIGVDNKKYQNAEIRVLKENFNDSLCKELETQVMKLNEFYIEMLRLLSKRKLVDDINIEDIKTLISSNIDDALKTDFQKEIVDKYDDDKILEDSLFFLPIVDQILKLTR